MVDFNDISNSIEKLKGLTALGCEEAINMTTFLHMKEAEIKRGNVYETFASGDCTYCGGNEREEDNKSCYSCGSVEFKFI